MVVLLLRSMDSLKQLYTLTMVRITHSSQGGWLHVVGGEGDRGEKRQQLYNLMMIKMTVNSQKGWG